MMSGPATRRKASDLCCTCCASAKGSRNAPYMSRLMSTSSRLEDQVAKGSTGRASTQTIESHLTSLVEKADYPNYL